MDIVHCNHDGRVLCGVASKVKIKVEIDMIRS
jgi:hypothetical protein